MRDDTVAKPFGFLCVIIIIFLQAFISFSPTKTISEVTDPSSRVSPLLLPPHDLLHLLPALLC